ISDSYDSYNLLNSSTLNTWRYSNPHGHGFLVRRLKDSLAVNVHQSTHAEHARDQVRTPITDERQRQSFVGQERRGHTDVDCGLQSQQRNDATAKKQAKPILGVQRDQDAANNDDHEQKNHEQTEPQAKLFANNWKNEICMRVRQIKHFLATVTQAQSLHSPAAPGDQCLHLLQASVVLVVLGMQKGGARPHSLGDSTGNDQKPAKAGERYHTEP